MNAFLARTISAAILASVFSGNALAQRLERTQTLPAGLSWVNQVQSSGSFGTGTTELESRTIDIIWEGHNLRGVQSPEGTLLVQPPLGGWVGVIGVDGKANFTWDPPLRFETPLEVGKSWVKNHQLTLHKQNRTVPLEVRSTVEAFEDVTVPAGTFKAFRVRYTDNIGNQSVDWYSPDLRIFVKRSMERTENHQAGPGRRETELKSHTIRLPQ